MLIDYLKAYAERHAGLLTKTAEQRLADKLLDLGYRSGREHPKGVEVEVTNEQLGSLADVSLFTASRLLSGWERKGAVLKERGKVVIRSPEALVVD
jgi:CRP-like cAMP-binding protein